MFYSIMAANLLKSRHEEKLKFEYDVVVRTRFDAALLKPIETFIVEDKKIVGIDCIFTDADVLSDWLFYCSSPMMDDICDIYNDLDDHNREMANFCGEGVLRRKIQASGYNVHKLFPGQHGTNLVLVRGARTAVRGWTYYDDLP